MASPCFMFWGILIGTFSYAVILWILRVVLHLFFQETDKESQLRRQISDLKLELMGINMTDEFAKYAKIQRKINKANDELNNQVKSRSMSMLKMKMAVNVVVHVLGVFYVLFLLWNYHDEVVLKVPEEWIYPFNTILSFPLNVTGAVGTTSWLFICNHVARKVVKIAH